MSTAESSQGPVNRHAPTAVERQRLQLDKLLKDPTKSAHVPPPPKEKTIRPAREMMKNVQGSSAGAGSGEFHVYKASRRREYERLKLLDEAAQKEAEQAEFERKKREAEEQTEAKTAKNRAKRQKKKERAKGKGITSENGSETRATNSGGNVTDFPMKKRRLINGKELVFRKSGAASDDDDEGDLENASDEELLPEGYQLTSSDAGSGAPVQPQVLEAPKFIIHDD